ncbi:MAG: DUF177 domain-containing protein [Deltaproteobacteria bacterium]|nr:DUF177 domain-containing protein [Deltaproteobacteria bacterium]
MANSLKINVFLLPEEGQSFIFSEGNAWFKDCFSDSEKPDFILEKVDVNCLITKTSGTVFIKGSFSALIDIDCSRCLERASLPIGSDFAYTLYPAQAESREDLELMPEELEVSYYQGDIIDLAPIICEQIILQIPMKVLCSEECKGLCPHCGANLNTSSCKCHLNFVDDRMAVLKNFRVKN